MTISEKEARRLSILKAIYEITEGIITRNVYFEQLHEKFFDYGDEFINSELLYFRERGLTDGPEPIRVMGHAPMIHHVRLSAHGRDTIEDALRGKSTPDFSEQGIKIFIEKYVHNENTISNSSNSNILAGVNNSTVSINYDTESQDISMFLQAVKAGVSEELKVQLMPLIESAETILQSKDSVAKKSLKGIITAIVSIGGSVVGNLLTQPVKALLDIP